MKNVLVTGGCGFIGSNLILHLINNCKNINVINFDKLTYAGRLEYLDNVKLDGRHTFIKGDICNEQQVEFTIEQYNVDSIIHLAAESHVDNSITNPLQFITTNVYGTGVLLEAFRKHCTGRFHYVNTDEVYGALGNTGMFTEETPLAPNSPYSASKAGGGLLVRSYQRTYNIDAVITSCSNNFGPHQHEEKLIPTVIRTALSLDTIPVYGDGKNVRDWLYVHDHCRAIELVFRDGLSGEIYNIGGDCEINNIDLVTTLCKLLDRLKPRTDGVSYVDQISFVQDRKGHDFRYAVDCTKLKTELGWSPSSNFDELLESTVKYYID